METLPAGNANEAAEGPAAEEVPEAPAETFELLSAPRGAPDDLTKLSGVGPQLDKKLNDAGIFHYWQIGAMTPEDVKKLDAELKRLHAQIAKTALVFRLRSIDSDEIDAINRKHPLEKGADEATKGEVGLARLMEQLATQVFSPRVFTADELTRLRKAVGEPEFNKLMVAMNEVGSATAAASTPFWRGNSGARQS